MDIFFSDKDFDVTKEVQKPLEVWFNGDVGTLTCNGTTLEKSIEIILWGVERGVGYKSSYHKSKAIQKDIPEGIVAQVYFTPLTGKMAGLPCCMLVSGNPYDNLETSMIIARKSNPMHEYSCTISVIPYGSYEKHSLKFEFKHLEKITPEIEEVKKWIDYVKEKKIDVKVALPDTLKPLAMISPAKD